jgi:hypothetical protein
MCYFSDVPLSQIFRLDYWSLIEENIIFKYISKSMYNILGSLVILYICEVDVIKILFVYA